MTFAPRLARPPARVAHPPQPRPVVPVRPEVVRFDLPDPDALGVVLREAVELPPPDALGIAVE